MQTVVVLVVLVCVFCVQASYASRDETRRQVVVRVAEPRGWAAKRDEPLDPESPVTFYIFYRLLLISGS